MNIGANIKRNRQKEKKHINGKKRQKDKEIE
jgi:hypothetical protein